MSTKVKKITGKKVATIVGAYFIAWLFVYPYINMFLTSVKSHDELYATPTTYLPRVWQWRNYIDVWDNAPIASFLKSSLIVSLSATILVLIVSVPAAYFISRYRFKMRGPFLLLVLATQMFSPTALIIGIFREVDFFKLLDSYLALIILNAGFNLAFAIWLLSGFFSSIPVEIEEAALIDGCTRMQALRRVTLPIALPGLVTAVIFTFVAAWNEFTIALTIMSSVDKKPIPVGITQFIGQYDIAWEFLFTSTIIAIIPVVILFISIEKYLVGGLTAGSVK
ncbi:MAG: carbohydrate ABC transporter permease [Candidatus Nanopelagicus sp.]|jgi:multiple sugar transport system permease protein|nr:carbohydrate ABC transporter permease [Candidatus Nanopelagicus sp.]